MELTIALAISILSIVFSILGFAFTRKDKSNEKIKQETKEFSKHDLIEWRLDDITKKVDRILDKLDTYSKETDEKIETAMQHHINEYHKTK